MGWNGSDNADATFSALKATDSSVDATGARVHDVRGMGRGILAGLVIVLGGALAVWFILGRSPKASARNDWVATKKSQIEEVQPATVAPLKTVPSSNHTARMEKGIEVVRSTITTNKGGAVIERLWLANGTTVRKIQPAKPLFDNPSDQLIAMAVSATPGHSMPPLPDLSNVDADFAKSLLKPIRIEENDSEEVKDIKAKVMEARAYLAEQVKNGSTVREALNAYQADMEKYADAHLMAVQELQEVRAKDGDEAAEEFRKR